jgi:hypothetical protein
MAGVFAPPNGFEPPSFDEAFVDGRYDYKHHDRINQAYFDRLAAEARRLNKGDMVGEIFRHPVADGYAVYMVWSHRPFSLIHISIDDGYRLPEAHERGLRLSDVRQSVQGQRALDDLFASKA